MLIRRLQFFIGFLLVSLSGHTIVARPTIVVSIPPQKTFVEAIAGESVEIITLLKPGQNPGNFSITPKTLAKVSKSDLYFTIGSPMETALIPRLEASYPDLLIVDTAAGIRKRSLEDHSHAPQETLHAHVDDPHIWLSPGLVKIQLRHYLRALKYLLPEKSEAFDRTLDSFLNKLEVVDKQLKEILLPAKGSTVFVYHPAFGYFLDRYGLRQETVELKGKQPSPQQLRYLIQLARAHKTKVIFVQPQFDRHSADALARALDGNVVSMDPLAENYLDNLLLMGETIAESHR